MAVVTAPLLFLAEGVLAQQTIVAPAGEPTHFATYRETTAGRGIELRAREWVIDGGLFLESVSSAGDRHVVVVDKGLGTLVWQHEYDNTIVRARREGDTVIITGRGEGAPHDGAIELDEPRWVQSIERSLRTFIGSGAPGDRLRFLVVQPDNLTARTLVARIMGDEEIEVNGIPVATRRVRISLPGIGSIFWRSNYWYRLSDGLFVQSKVTRGPPGTPETLVVLTSEE